MLSRQTLQVGPINTQGWAYPHQLTQLHQYSCVDYPELAQQASYEQFKVEEYQHQFAEFLRVSGHQDSDFVPFTYSKPVAQQSLQTRMQVLYSLAVFYTVMHAQYTERFNGQVLGNTLRLYARTALRMSEQEATQAMAGLDSAVQIGMEFLAHPHNPAGYIEHVNVLLNFASQNKFEGVCMFRDVAKLWMAAYLETGNLFSDRVYNSLLELAAEFEVWANGFLFVLKEVLREHDKLAEYKFFITRLAVDIQLLLGVDVENAVINTSEQLEEFQFNLFRKTMRLADNQQAKGKFFFNLALPINNPKVREGNFSLFN